jgi:hypothetical protein
MFGVKRDCRINIINDVAYVYCSHQKPPGEPPPYEALLFNPDTPAISHARPMNRRASFYEACCRRLSVRFFS